MLACYARHKVAIGTRCVSGEGLRKSLKMPARTPISEGRGGMRIETMIHFFW